MRAVLPRAPNGLADRRAMLARNDSVIARMEFAHAIMPELRKLPGGVIAHAWR